MQTVDLDLVPQATATHEIQSRITYASARKACPVGGKGGSISIVMQTPEVMLVESIRAYDYPSVTYDFMKGSEHCFGNMRDLESYLQNLLRANDEQRVRDGLSGVL